MERLKQMTFYCTTGDCLRHSILRYFGEKSASVCGNCSNCLSSAETADITEDARKILSCIIRSGQHFGKKMICDILRGSQNARLQSFGLQNLSTYGILKSTSEREIRDRMDYLEEKGYLCTRGDEYPILNVTPQAQAVSHGDIQLLMKVIKPKPAAKEKKPREAAGDLDYSLFEELKRLRLQLAREQDVPAYIVFSDATLRDMCVKRPATLAEFTEVNGVGQAKRDLYGGIFTARIREYEKTSKKV